jgi:transposase-like protein
VTSPLPYIKTLLDFQRAFPDEPACLAYLEKVRWPDGFVCPTCGTPGAPYLFATEPRWRGCRACQARVSLTAGTVMHRAKKPLQLWFWAAYLVTSQTPGMSALQFRRQLGIKRYETAFMMLHKLRAGMVRANRDQIGVGIDRETGGPKSYSVEMDEAYVGGRTRGKGRGVTDKVIVAGAVEERWSEKINEETGKVKRRRYAGRLRLRLVPDRGKAALTEFACENVVEGTVIKTDDWTGYLDLPKYYTRQIVRADAGMPELTKLEAKAAKGEKMPIIHLVFSNLKTWILGTHHGVSPKHLPAYLNEFVFRFNRRFYPMSAFHALLGIAVTKRGPEYAKLYGGTWLHPNSEEEPGETGVLL